MCHWSFSAWLNSVAFCWVWLDFFFFAGWLDDPFQRISLVTCKPQEMDCATSWEYKSLINELTQGMEKAKQLRMHLSSTSSEAQEFLMQRILSSYEKALLILKWSGSSTGQSQQSTPPSSACGALESSISVDGSPRSEELNRNFRDQKEQNMNASKKRWISFVPFK